MRTAWLYGRHGKNFVYTMLKAMRDREEVGVVTDQRGNPTWARDLAESILRIALSGSEAYGTYHFTDRGETTWYEFAWRSRALGLAAGLLQRKATAQAPDFGSVSGQGQAAAVFGPWQG